MTDKKKHEDAKKLIDKLTKDLLKLSDGEPISTYWKTLLKKSIKSANESIPKKETGVKPDMEKELVLMTEYLRILCNENRFLNYDHKDVNADFYAEEKAPHGSQVKLAKQFDTSESQVSKIIKKWLNDEALLKQLILHAGVKIIGEDLFS